MAITYVGGVTDGAVGSTSTNTTVDISGISMLEGDLVIVGRATGSIVDENLNIVTAGYTRFVDLFRSDTKCTNLFASYKFMGSTPDTSVVVPPSGDIYSALTIVVQVYRGVDASVFDVTTTTATAANSVLPNPPAITPTQETIMVCIGAGTHTRGVATFAATKLTDFLTIGQNDQDDGTIGMGYRTISTTYNPSQRTFSSSNSTQYSRCACTIALKPAGSTANTTNFFFMM